MQRKIKRLSVQKPFSMLPRCIVGMAACLSAYFVSHTLRGMGFEPRIIPAIYVKPLNEGQKNDYNDAEAIAEAALRPNLIAVRKRTKTSSICKRCIVCVQGWCRGVPPPSNQIRACLIGQGIAVLTGLRASNTSFDAMLEQRQDEISPRIRGVLTSLRDD